jgi:hypothetical protein
MAFEQNEVPALEDAAASSSCRITTPHILAQSSYDFSIQHTIELSKIPAPILPSLSTSLVIHDRKYHIFPPPALKLAFRQDFQKTTSYVGRRVGEYAAAQRAEDELPVSLARCYTLTRILRFVSAL